jgi:hypothetical protein
MKSNTFAFGLISGAAPSGFNWQVLLHAEGGGLDQVMNFKTTEGMNVAMLGLGLKLSKGGASYLPAN